MLARRAHNAMDVPRKTAILKFRSLDSSHLMNCRTTTVVLVLVVQSKHMAVRIEHVSAKVEIQFDTKLNYSAPPN